MNQGNRGKKFQVAGKLARSFKGYHWGGRIVRERDFSLECSAIDPQNFDPVPPRRDPLNTRSK